MRIVMLLLALLVPSVCHAEAFRPEVFFAGATHGDGVLKVMMRRAKPLTVDGRGHVESDGTLVLDQRIDDRGKITNRSWRITPVGGGRYTGTLTEAKGPISAWAEGDVLHIACTMKNNMRVRQMLTLSADGQSAENVMRVSRMGIVVARLRETIRRVP